jgi:cell division protease FtsH
MKATRLARAMVTTYGMSDEFGFMCLEQRTSMFLNDNTSGDYSDDTAAKIDGAVKKIIDQCYEKAKTLLVENKDKLDMLSEVLYEKENITGKEFLDLLGIEPEKPENESENE